jgi:hypothetical protein
MENCSSFCREYKLQQNLQSLNTQIQQHSWTILGGNYIYKYMLKFQLRHMNPHREEQLNVVYKKMCSLIIQQCNAMQQMN